MCFAGCRIEQDGLSLLAYRYAGFRGRNGSSTRTSLQLRRFDN